MTMYDLMTRLREELERSYGNPLRRELVIIADPAACIPLVRNLLERGITIRFEAGGERCPSRLLWTQEPATVEVEL